MHLESVYRVIDVASKKIIWAEIFKNSENEWIAKIDGRCIVFLCRDRKTEINTLRAYDAKTGKRLWEKQASSSDLYLNIKVDLDSDTLYCMNATGILTLMNDRTGEETLKIDVPRVIGMPSSDVENFVKHPNLTILGSKDSFALLVNADKLFVFDKHTGKVIRNLELGPQKELRPHASAFFLDGGMIYLMSNQYLHILDVRNGSPLAQFDCQKDLFKDYSKIANYFRLALTPETMLLTGCQPNTGPRSTDITIVKSVKRPYRTESILNLPPAMNSILNALLENEDPLVRKYAVIALANNTATAEDKAELERCRALETDRNVLAAYEQVLDR